MNKDYYNFMKWNDLTMKQRAEVINLAVKNGIRDLDSIKSFYNDHTYEIGGFTQALQSYTEPETVEAAAAKLALQLADPTGISSYPDVAAAYNDFTSSPSLKSLGNLALETVGALPLIGKVSTPFKAAKTAKLLKRIGEAGKVANVAENVRAANKAIDTFPELIPGVRRIAEKTQDFTTRTIVDPLFKKYASANKLDKVRDFRNTNIGIDLVNGANTTSDITAGTREMYNASSKKALGGPLVSIANAHRYDGTTEDNQQIHRPAFLDDITYLPAEEYEFGVVADKPGKPKNQQFGQRVYAERHPRLIPEQWQEYWGNKGAGYVNAARNKVAPYFMAGAALAAAPALLPYASAIITNPYVDAALTTHGLLTAPENIRKGVSNFRKGNYVSGAVDLGSAGLDLLGAGILADKVGKFVKPVLTRAGEPMRYWSNWLYNDGNIFNAPMRYNPNNYYREVTKEAIDDAANSGVIRTGNFNKFIGPYFGKGYSPWQREKYIIEGYPENNEWIYAIPYENAYYVGLESPVEGKALMQKALSERIPTVANNVEAFPYTNGSVNATPTTNFSYWKKYPLLGWRKNSFRDVKTPTITPKNLENQYEAYGGPMGTYYDRWGDIRNWLITKAKRRK